MLKYPVLPFSRRLPACPKCGGKLKRSYCRGEYGLCSEYFSPLRGKEHHDLNCQECQYELYMKVQR
jgi:hypothetical protein